MPDTIPAPSPVAGDISLATEVVTSLIQFVPALNPYAVIIDTGMAVVEKVAPLVYDEITSLIAKVNGGGVVTPAEEAKLASLIDDLEHPEQFFVTPEDVKALIASIKAQTLAQASDRQAAQVTGPVTQPGATSQPANALGHVSPMAPV